MDKALILMISAFIIFIIPSCTNNVGNKNILTSIDSMRGDTFFRKDSVQLFKPGIFYPDSSADTNLIYSRRNVAIYSVNHSGACYYHYDCVVKLSDGSYKSFNLWDDNMVDISLSFDSIRVQEQEINGRGNKELVINMPLEGHHMYGMRKVVDGHTIITG